MADQTKSKKKRPAYPAPAGNTMYYNSPEDRELTRGADESYQDSADPLLTDGYGPDQGVAGFSEDGEENFQVPTASDQTDDLPPASSGMPKSPLMTKLRKKGAPKASY